MGQSPAGAAEELASSQAPPASDTTASTAQSSSAKPATSTAQSSSAQPLATRFAQDYLSRFVGNSPRHKGDEMRNKQSQILEEHAKSDMTTDCCNLPLNLTDAFCTTSIKSAQGKTINTDLRSLLDANGDGVECDEVWRAICMVNPITDDEVTTREGRDSLDIEHRLGGDQVQLRLLPRPLEVPSQFKGIRYDWAAPSHSQVAPTIVQQERLEKCMRPFIQSMLLGVLVRLRLEDAEACSDSASQSINATISFSEDLSLLIISAGSTERSVPIKAIRWVRPPEKGEDCDKCADLRLAGGRFVRFHFNTQVQAKFFGTCMRLLVKATRSDASQRSIGSIAAPRSA